MKDLREELVNAIVNENKEKLIEMANLAKRRTKLPVNVWIDEVGSNRNVPHDDPRLKIQNDYGERANENLIPVSIDKENPIVLEGKLEIDNKDFKIIQKWIIENYKDLMRHWNGELDTDDLKDILRERGEYR